MNALPDEYTCHCQVPSPRLHMGEDSGLCTACSMVYDAALYEMRLRQYVPNFDYENLGEFLQAKDPAYHSVVG